MINALSAIEGTFWPNALGITVISGLLISALVSLILVPLVYSVVHGYRQDLKAES